jgi:uncharacterized repeat protein (TIGR02543 family)
LAYPDIPTRSGYVFAGWYTDTSYTTPYSFDGSITEDVTLYAKWLTNSKTNVINVGSSTTVTLNGTTVIYYAFVPLVSGSITVYSSGSYDTYGLLYNSSLTSLITDDDGGNNSNFSYTYNVTAGTLYYIGIRAYYSSIYETVTLNVSGTQMPTSTVEAVCGEDVGVEYSYGSTVTVVVEYLSEYTLPELTREGYTFLGWYNGDEKVESGEWNIVGDATLTPRWG